MVSPFRNSHLSLVPRACMRPSQTLSVGSKDRRVVRATTAGGAESVGVVRVTTAGAVAVFRCDRKWACWVLIQCWVRSCSVLPGETGDLPRTRIGHALLAKAIHSLVVFLVSHHWFFLFPS